MLARPTHQPGSQLGFIFRTAGNRTDRLECFDNRGRHVIHHAGTPIHGKRIVIDLTGGDDMVKNL
jgi:hypothetical protein